jgi:hypothetical protein
VAASDLVTDEVDDKVEDEYGYWDGDRDEEDEVDAFGGGLHITQTIGGGCCSKDYF